MRVSCAIASCVMLVAAALALAQTEPATSATDPAARYYSEAFARLTEADIEATTRPINDVRGIDFTHLKLDHTLRKLLERNSKTLELIHQGARQPRCNWSQVRCETAESATHPSTNPTTISSTIVSSG